MSFSNNTLNLMDELMSALANSDFWRVEQMRNPEILAADRELTAALDKLRSVVSAEAIDRLSDSIYHYATAYETAAILYGIYAADAIHTVAAHPSELSRYILKRVKRQKGVCVQ